MERSFNFSEFLIKTLVWFSAATSAESSSPTKQHWKRLALYVSLWNVANRGINLDPPSRKPGEGKVFSPLAAVGRDFREAALQQGAGGEKFKERLQSRNTEHLCGYCCLLSLKKMGVLCCSLFTSWAFPFLTHKLVCLFHLFRSLGAQRRPDRNVRAGYLCVWL